MSKLKDSMYKRAILASLILLLTLVPYLHLRADVQAAAFTSISDTMTRQKASTAANHTIAFTQNGSTQFVSGETITITFESTFDTSSLANTDPLDYDITINGTEETLVAAGCGATDEIEITSIAADVITFTACGSLTAEAAGSAIVVEIGTHTSAPSAGDTQIVNATSSGSKIISLGGTIGDTGQIAVPILADDQVVVSATVDPTITSTISTATCVITPALLSTTVDSCSYTNNIATNASGGYVSTMLEDGEFRDGANTITDVSDGAVDTAGGDEEYGASTSHTNVGPQDILVWDGACDTDASDSSENASPITGTAKAYSDHSGPVDETTTLCHSATITTITEAGSYSHTVTHITTGTF